MTSTGSELLHQLAILGVEMDCPSIVATNQPVSIADEAIVFAHQIHSWQIQLASLPANTQLVVRHLFNHLKSTHSLNGWDAWLASMLEMPLTGHERGISHSIFSRPLDPHSITTPQLFSVALVMARQGLLSPTALVMGWILIRETSLLLESRDSAEDLCAAVVQMALEGCSQKCNETASISFDDWIHHAQICISLKDITKCITRGSEYASEEAIDALFNIAMELKDAQDRLSTDNGNIISNELWIADSLRRIKTGDTALGYRQLSNLASEVQLLDSNNGDQTALQQLKINAFTQLIPDLPRLTLVDSKSLPRSGHHYLKLLLQESHRNTFSYCEKYQEPGCCNVSPCRAEAYWSYARNHSEDHLRLIKSHDFQLNDPILQPIPGLIRLVQIRQPRHLLISWLELHHIQINREMLHKYGIASSRINLYHEKILLSAAWKAIDESGLILTIDEAKKWLASKEAYIVGFLKKWLPYCEALSAIESQSAPYGNYVVRYEDLGHHDAVLRGLGRRKHMLPGEAKTIEFTPRQEKSLNRESIKIGSLLDNIHSYVALVERRILDETSTYQRLMRYTPIPSSVNES
jgi:hypothetical protein